MFAIYPALNYSVIYFQLFDPGYISKKYHHAMHDKNSETRVSFLRPALLSNILVCVNS